MIKCGAWRKSLNGIALRFPRPPSCQIPITRKNDGVEFMLKGNYHVALTALALVIVVGGGAAYHLMSIAGSRHDAGRPHGTAGFGTQCTGAPKYDPVKPSVPAKTAEQSPECSSFPPSSSCRPIWIFSRPRFPKDLHRLLTRQRPERPRSLRQRAVFWRLAGEVWDEIVFHTVFAQILTPLLRSGMDRLGKCGIIGGWKGVA